MKLSAVIDRNAGALSLGPEFDAPHACTSPKSSVSFARVFSLVAA